MSHLLFVAVLLSTGAAAPPRATQPGLVVHFVGRNDKTPELAWLIVVSPRGHLRNLMSHPIDDDDLRKGLRFRGADKKIMVEIEASAEDDTSIKIFINAVERVKKFVDPKAETVIYIRFQLLTGPRRALK